MQAPEMTRRAFAGILASAPAAFSASEWTDLFDGHSLSGWRASESAASWKIEGGAIAAAGPRSHLFYTGPVAQAQFRNFELEVEALAEPAANSGVYFHTAWQEKGFPEKGFEVQINNTATGEGTYRERKKTGSLYGLRNIYKQLVKDGEWFRLNTLVRGKNVQVRLNGTLLVDYTEPETPYIPAGLEKGRYLDRGTFALQCHDPGSRARFRRIRVRPLPDSEPTPGPLPVADATFKALIDLGRANIPVVDYHTHIKGTLTLDQVLAKGRRDGIGCGIAINCGQNFPVQDDAGALKFIESMRGVPAFAAMQAEGREWTKMFSRAAAGQFDYIFTDSMTWTDNRGRRMRTWIADEVGTIADPQEFMDTLVARATGILESEPVDIYVNPTYLPDVISRDYDKLWTDERMRKLVTAAAKNGIAIELNDRYRLPGQRFVQMAKDAGCKFTFGTNNTGADDLRRCEYGIEMVRACKLGWQDFFVPAPLGSRAVDRKPGALRAA